MATKHFLGGRIILGTEFVGYKFKFFEPGTSTPKTTYKDSSLTAGNENTATVTLDANGAAQIWFDGNADVVFYTSADVVVYSDDDINVSTTASTSGTGNLIVNGSFETDADADGIPDNWTRTLYTSGTFSLQTTDQFNGQKSIKFTSTGTGGGYITSTDTFAVSPSVVYTVGWAMKGTADVRNVVEILWYQDDGSASGVTASTTAYDDSTTNPTSWTEKWYEATSPSDAAFASIRLTGCHSSDATSGNTAYDSVVFTDLVHRRGTTNFTLTSTDAGAGSGPALKLYRNSASPASSDKIGVLLFSGKINAGTEVNYANITAQISDSNDASADGKILFETWKNGATQQEASLGGSTGGLVLGSPTGDEKGSGTINAASGIYDNGKRTHSATAEYNSGNQTITSAGALTLAHGLPAEPTRVTCWLKCLTGEHGFSVGDKALAPLTSSDAATDTQGFSLVADATNLTIRFGTNAAVFTYKNKTTGAGVALTNANWALVVIAQ